MPEYEPYELSYQNECDKTERLEMEIIHLEEERDISKEQLGNWQNLCQRIPTQIVWCDLCLISKLDKPDVCSNCIMGNKFEYDEVAFGEVKDE